MNNNLIITLRLIKKQKMYAFINILGLAFGMACCFLILSFIQTEMSFDTYHEKSDRIYRVISELTLGKTPNMIATTNSMAAFSMKEEISGIQEVARLSSVGRVSVKYNQEKEFYEDRIYYTEPSFLKIFSHSLVAGDPKTVLTSPRTAVISMSTAKRYFGDKDPMGEVLRMNGQSDYTIVGIIEDVPENSHFTFDILLSFESLYLTNGREAIENWSTPFFYYSYVLLDSNQNPADLEKQFPGLIERNINESWKKAGVGIKFFLQPITDIHLHSDLRHEIGVHSDIKYVYIFGSIAVFVLIIACFNFMNLATARSTSRANEIGMRKVLGCDKKSLIIRFLGESVVYSLLSLVLALLLAWLCLPTFSRIAEIPLSLSFIEIPWLLPAAILLAILVGFICGLYPAFFLSSFPPKQAINPDFKAATNGKLFRKILVGAQFTISITLIICTHIVFNQLQFLKNKDLGFNKDQVIVIPVRSPEVRKSIEAIKQKLETYPGIERVAASSHVPGQRSSGGTYQPEGYDEGQTVMMDAISIDQEYLEAMEMKVIAGRGFSKEFPSDPEQSILINETAAKEIGWDDPINKRIKFPGEEGEGKKVVGVVKDFFFKSPHAKIRGIYISNGGRRHSALFVRISATNISGTIDAIHEEWKNFDSNRSLDYYFLDASYNEQYDAEEKLSSIFSYFTIFAIFIACLGLFGMASYTAEQKIKEVSIRKVLGASVLKVLILLSKNIFYIVLIALIISIPISLYVINTWLESFEYRTNIGVDVFIVAGLLAFVIAGLTVSLQSLKVAKANPVDSLRNE